MVTKRAIDTSLHLKFITLDKFARGFNFRIKKKLHTRISCEENRSSLEWNDLELMKIKRNEIIFYRRFLSYQRLIPPLGGYLYQISVKDFCCMHLLLKVDPVLNIYDLKVQYSIF